MSDKEKLIEQKPRDLFLAYKDMITEQFSYGIY